MVLILVCRFGSCSDHFSLVDFTEFGEIAGFGEVVDPG